MKLLNKSQLAAALGRSPTYVSAMQRAGYRLEFGTRDRLSHALKWLAANPDFRVTDAYPAPTNTPANPETVIAGK